MGDRFGNPIELGHRYLPTPAAVGDGARVPLDTGQRPMELPDDDLVRPVDLHRMVWFDDLWMIDSARWTVGLTAGADGSVSQMTSAASPLVDGSSFGVQRFVTGTHVDDGVVLHSQEKIMRLATGWSCEARLLWAPQVAGIVRFGWGNIEGTEVEPDDPALYFECDLGVSAFARIHAKSGEESVVWQSAVKLTPPATFVVRLDVESATECRVTVNGEDGGAVSTNYLPVNTTDDVGVFLAVQNGPSVPLGVADVDYIAVWKN